MAVNTLRPGVFSEYTLSSAYSAGKSIQHAAVVAVFAPQEAAQYPLGLTSYPQAAAHLTPDESSLLPLLRILFTGGASKIYLMPVAQAAAAADYKTALAALAQTDGIYAVITDAATTDTLAEVKSHVEACAATGRERLGFAGAAPDAAPALAAALNHERMVLVSPAAHPATTQGSQPQPTTAKAIYAAGALAAAVLTMSDPAVTLSGEVLPGIALGVGRLEDSTVEALLAAGITPLEQLGNQVQCIRALTTRTSTDGTPDRAFAPVNTALIIDDVMQAVRAALRLQLRGAKTTAQSLGAIASQVTVLLAGKQAQGIITGFDTPGVYQSPQDPTVCIVELAFGVAYAVNQIHIKAHVLV